MTVTEKNGNLVSIDTDAGHILHRKGSGDYTQIRHITVPAGTAGDWEEIAVADIPPYTEDEYDAKVEELIRMRYSVSQEFALINNIMANATTKRQEEYDAYQEYRELCKRQAREMLGNGKTDENL